MSNDKTKKLLADAHKTGALSASGHATLDVIDLGAQIQAGLGVAVDDVAASEVVLVSMMPDDSASISGAGNVGNVRDGHNLVLDALGKSRQAGEIFVHTRYLNGHVLTPYAPLTSAVRMTAQNYQADKGTPLYDQTVVLLGTVVAKSQEFAQDGVPVRTVTLLITDGEDAGWRRCGPRNVRTLVEDMLAQECHVVAAMGIPDRWILTPGNSATEIRRAFQVFSQSAAAIGGGAALGGFGN